MDSTDATTDTSMDTEMSADTNNPDHYFSEKTLTADEKDIELLWAKEQYEMNQSDREAASYELHGVESRYDTFEYENPESLYQALSKFDEELNNPKSTIPCHLKQAYHRALCLNSTYVVSSEFRLRFLRAEFFQIARAVTRFCKCLVFLVSYFGEISLMRQLLLSDLNKREIKLLKEGSMQLSPYRDSLGRRIFFLMGNCGGNYSSKERDRVGFYLLFQVLAEDVTTQRNGLVSVHFMSEDVHSAMGGENAPKMSRLFLDMFEASPLRFSAVHMCFRNDFAYRLLKPLMLFLIGEKGRKVLKIHSGTSVECIYSLSSFGVRAEDIPTTYSGTVKTRQHMKWIKVRAAMDKYIEEQAKTHVNADFRLFYSCKIKAFPHIQCPEINCVLFHKNGVAWEFPGNVKFRAFLDEEFSNDECIKDISHPKEEILNRIIELARLRRFQFLLHDDTKHWYDELTEDNQLKKYVGFAYRGHLRRRSARRHSQGNGMYDAEERNIYGCGKVKYRNKDFHYDVDPGKTKKIRKETPVFTNMNGQHLNSNCNTTGCFG